MRMPPNLDNGRAPVGQEASDPGRPLFFAPDQLSGRQVSRQHAHVVLPTPDLYQKRAAGDDLPRPAMRA